MNERQKKDYLDSHGLICPFCASNDLESGGQCHEVAQIKEDISCNNCGKEWVDTYTLTDVEPQE